MDRGATGTASWRFAALLLWATAGCGDGDPKPVNSRSSGNPATAPLDYLAVQGKATRHSESATSLAQVHQALQQFRASEDRWPESLDELVKAGFLAKVPVMPVGQSLTYDPRTGAVRVAR